jgi:hypothetical protein
MKTANNKPQTAGKKKASNKPVPKLTRKQKAFVNTLIQNPKMSATQAVKLTYNVKNDKVAGTVASENMAKPVIRMQLAKHSNLIESVITDTIAEYKDSNLQWQRVLAVNTAQWTHDKIHGKATQQTTSVNYNFTKHVTDKQTDYGL